MAKKSTAEEIEAKLEVIDRMNAAVAKLTNAQIRLKLAGEDALAGQIDTGRKALIKQIEKLQGQVADEWATGAAELAEHLRRENSKVQDRIRNIKNNVSVANNAVKIIGQVDTALAFLKTVVPGV